MAFVWLQIVCIILYTCCTNLNTGPLDGVDFVPVTLPKVSCGAHTAPDCSKCPQGNGPALRKRVPSFSAQNCEASNSGHST